MLPGILRKPTFLGRLRGLLIPLRAPFGHHSPECKHDGHHDHHPKHDSHGHHAQDAHHDDHDHHDHTPKRTGPYYPHYPHSLTDEEINKLHIADTISPHTRTATMYYSDPEVIAYKVCAIIALHDEIKTKEIRLEHTWKDLGLSELGKVEVVLELENEFALSLAEEVTERWRTVYDAVQYIAKSPYLH